MTIILIDGRRLRLLCDGCSIEFEKPNHTHIRKKERHFHSNDCFNQFQKRNKKNIRNKICAYCGEHFYDDSKRPDAGTCCSKEHSYALMSKTRHERGSYKQTEEQNRKRVATIRTRHGSFAACQTQDSRKKCSERSKLAWHLGLMEKLEKACLIKYGVTHWMKTEEGRAMASKLHLGRVHTDETRRRMSISAGKRVRTKRETNYTSAKGGIREDLNQYFRSNWEANYARILNLENKVWKYEVKTFQLSEGSYTPDFWIEDDNTFVEIKGRSTALQKFQLFCKEFPSIKIKLIDAAEYVKLRKQYKDIIIWEGK